MQQKRKYLAAMLSVVFAVSLLMNTFAVGVFAQDDREVLVEQIVSELQQDNSEADQSQKGETPAMRPEETAIPEVTASAEPVMTPAPAASPAATETPEFTATPETSAVPTPTATPETSATPEPTVTPEPSATPEPTVTPEPSATPEPTEVPLPTVEEQKAQIRDLLEKSTSAGQMSEDELERALEEIDALASTPLAIAENGQEDDELSDLMDQLENARVAMEDMRAAWEAKREGRLDQLPQTGRENSWRYQNGETVEYDTMDAAMDLPDGVSAFSVGGGYWGIDVSHHQGVIDWEAVKAAGIDFAIIRCGYGMNLPEQDDKQWSRNVSECERLGIPYGVYFYSYAMTADMAVEEAIHAVRLLEGHNPDLPVFYDMEENRQLVVGNSGLAEMARIFCDIVSSKGYEVGVYANLNWWNHYLTDAVFENWYRWVAEWRSSCSYNGRYEMWQYTDEGQISGINGFVDMNYWYGDLPGDERVPVAEGNYTISSALDGNKGLSIAGESLENGANVELRSLNGSAAQQFKIISAGENYYRIENVASGKMLDVEGGFSELRTNVQQWEYNGSEAQLWCFEDAGNGYYYIRSKCNGLYLDIDSGLSGDGANVQVYLKNQSDAQKFRLQTAHINVKVEEGIYVISSVLDASKVLNIAEGSTEDTANLQLGQSNGSMAQRFAISVQSDGSYKITNMGSGKVLDVVSGSSVPGTNVWQYTSNDSDAQRWYFEQAKNGAYYLRSKCNGLYLDVAAASTADGTNIQVYTGNGSEAQQFRLQKVESQEIPEGLYTIVSALDSNKVVDISSGSTANGANVQLYTNNGSTAQKFQLVSAGNGQYYVINAASGKALDVKDGASEPRTNVQQWERNNNEAQMWSFEDAGDGYYYIRSKCNGLYLDIDSASSADGANVQVYLKNQSDAQKFRLQPTSLNSSVEDGIYVISSMLDTSKVLDIAAASMADTANLQLYQSNGSFAQRFVITKQSDGSYKITNLRSEKVLDVAYGYTEPESNVWQYSSNDSDVQRWYFEEAGNGAYYLRSKASDLYLDVANASTENGANIQINRQNRSVAQQFRLEKVGDLIPEGVYTIASGLDSSKVVDISAASVANGANVQLYTTNGSVAQKFRFVSAGEGQYYIMNVGSGKVLDVTSGSSVPGTNVQQWEKNNTGAQRWWLENAGNGMYYIRSVGTELFLDVDNASTADGTNIKVYIGNYVAAQQFALIAS